MHLFSIFVLAMGLAVTAFAEPSTGETQTAPPSLDRVTWVVNSCVIGDTNNLCPNDSESGLRPESLFQIRLHGYETGDLAVFVAVLNGSSDVHTFFGSVKSYRADEGLESVVVAFSDDPPGQTPVDKQLTIRRARLPDSKDSDCIENLLQFSDSKLESLAKSVCDGANYPELVYWSICSVDSNSGQCRRLRSDDISIMSPPDDGQGTASGND